MIQDRIAKRYAKSIFDLCKEKSLIKPIYDDFVNLKNVFDNATEVIAFLNSPIIRSEKKFSILEKMFSGHLNDLTMSFIKLVSARGREAVLPFVANEFIALYNADQNLTVVELICAIAMEDTQKKAIVSTFETKLKTSVILKEKIDPSIIGGFIVKVAGKQYDNSVASTLRKLKRDFKENQYIDLIGINS